MIAAKEWNKIDAKDAKIPALTTHLSRLESDGSSGKWHNIKR